MPLISSPGVAFIVVDEPPGASANAVFKSILSGWPVLLLTIMMALLSGIFMWGLVRALQPNFEWHHIKRIKSKPIQVLPPTHHPQGSK